jgi:hypothetical protein
MGAKPAKGWPSPDLLSVPRREDNRLFFFLMIRLLIAAMSNPGLRLRKLIDWTLEEDGEVSHNVGNA